MVVVVVVVVGDVCVNFSTKYVWLSGLSAQTQTQILLRFFYFWTNLGPILVELFVEHILHPQ